MSSGSRGGPPIGRYGNDHDHGKRRKNYYAASTRRDFKSSTPATSMAQTSHRVEKPPSESTPRPRYRDVSGNSPNLTSSGLRSSYNKDSRYSTSGLYPKQAYSSFQQGHYSERNVAYGSFNNHKRDLDSYGAYGSSSRDTTSRDLISGPSQRSEPSFARDSWRAERPKLNSSASSKSFSSPSRFNPNNIPVSSRGGLSGLVSSVSKDQLEHFDSYNDESQNRWKPSYSSSRPDKLSRSPHYVAATSRYLIKDRGRSSALTNSMGSSSRNDSSYSRNYNGNRFVDRYSRSSPDNDRTGQDEKQRHYIESVQHDSDRSMDQSRDDDFDDEETSKSYTDERYRDGEDEDEEEEHKEEEKNYDQDADEDDNTETNIDQADEAESASNQVKKESNIVNNSSEAPETALITADITPNGKIIIDSQYIDYPDGCIYPMPRLEAELIDLEKEFKARKPNKSLYGLKQTRLLSHDISEYPSHKEILRNFTTTSNDRIKLIKDRSLTIKKKRLSLWIDYEKRKAFNDQKRKDLEEQLLVIHPTDDEFRRELSAIDIRVKQPTSTSVAQLPVVEPPPQTSRRGRRHGDLVTTEAEFQEILKSLENEQDEDPVSKAKRVSASIPDLILDPVEVSSSNFMDSNNIVHDKDAWALRIRYDFIDNFSEKEHDLFCEAFCRTPKRFGEIARYMGGFRTAEECVAHYYMTKKAMSYKFLVSQFKKKTSRKSSRRKSSKPKTLTTPIAGELLEDLKSETLPETLPEPSTEENNELLTEEIPSKRHITDDSGSEEPAKKKSRVEHNEIHSGPSVTGNTEESQAPVPNPEIDNGTSLRQPNGFKEPITEPEKSVTENLAESVAVSTHAVLGLQTEPPEVPDQKRQNSSYWSITDVNEFPHLLSTYGSKWSSIAEHFPTKTATMVRNYYQRNAEKYGWNELVTTADHRLAQGANGEAGGINSIDSTIVVKPQRTALEQILNGMQVYNSTAGKYPNAPENPPHPVPMGTFQNPAQLSGVSDSHAVATDSERPRVTVSVTTPIKSEEFHPISRPEGHQKPSIMSLLNNDATPVKPTNSGPAFVAIKSNNVSDLLNAQSSPPGPHREAQNPDRRGSVKSLLQD